ncbi:alpha-1-antiproteinase 2-like [Monodelphis domestica]|uniref:alpha-1-antiproteinase 2-like n=1 Tax=Monodelphis domestica TaxID=13616 RepID=UPI0024E20939|nr:alpha-1-antiproteinase 2-like [Monodelphis domestica]
MQLTLYVLLVVACIPKAIFCQEQSDTGEKSLLAHHKIRSANSAFAGRLLKLLISENPQKNVFFSPLSMATSFAMLSLGARTATLTNLLEGLGFNLTKLQEREMHEGFPALFHLLNTTQGKVQLESGNNLFIDDKIQPLQRFLDEIRNLYGAQVFAANFTDAEGAKKHINDHVDKKTHGKIPELFKDLDSDTVMVLINYIFFNGIWETSFNSNHTELQDFYVDKNTTVRVPKMMKKEKLYYHREDELFSSMVMLPYEGNAWLILVLPDEGKLEQFQVTLEELHLFGSRGPHKQKKEIELDDL